jgi:hypothetical protein
MDSEVIWRPNPGPQASFVSCPIFEVFFGGASGGGKSDALLVDALGQVDKPRYRALLIRRSYGELTELILRSKELYPRAFPGAKFNNTEKTWTFPSGAFIKFGYLSTDDDVYQYQGQSYVYVGLDELTHYSEWSYKYLVSRIRTSDPTLTCYIRATGNPGGPGHHWVKARFVDPAPPMTPIYDERTKTSRVFIPSRVTDNPYLMATGYADRLEALSDADRKALKEGDWNAYQGSVFDLKPGIHRWTWAQFKERTGHDGIPADWQRFRTFDHGYAKPYACYWIATDYQGRGFVYREEYGCAVNSRGEPIANEGVRLDPEAVGEKIAAIERAANESPMGTADPSMWNKGRGDYGGGLSPYEMMARHGVYWTKANNDRLAGKMAVHDRLKVDDSGWPGLIFIEEECPHAIRTIPALEYDKHRVEDVNSAMEDHAYDAIRYWCVGRPWASSAPTKKKRSRYGDDWMG